MKDDAERLHQEVRDVWDANADFWDGRMGEGNDFHRLLIEPAQLRRLGLQGGESVLDVACGVSSDAMEHPAGRYTAVTPRGRRLR